MSVGHDVQIGRLARTCADAKLNYSETVRLAFEAGASSAVAPRRAGLTPAQRELLMFIREFVETNGFPPSFDEMRDAVGLRSKSGIHRLVTALEERGAIRRLPNRARAIELVAA